MVRLFGFEPKLLPSDGSASASWAIIALKSGGAEDNRNPVWSVQATRPTTERRPRKIGGPVHREIHLTLYRFV